MTNEEVKKEIKELHNQAITEASRFSSNATMPEKLARQTEALGKAVKLFSNYKDAVNELCYKCGRYEESHLGACDGCRWEAER